MVLSLLVAVKALLFWQCKSFVYIYGFQGDGLQANDPNFEIRTAYPSLDPLYGILAGLAYSIPNGACAMALPLFPKGYSRKMVLAITVLVAGASMYASGFTNGLIFLAVARVLHGAVNSFTNPLMYSLTAEYFP